MKLPPIRAKSRFFSIITLRIHQEFFSINTLTIRVNSSLNRCVVRIAPTYQREITICLSQKRKTRLVVSSSSLYGPYTVKSA